jgi:tetratricopeptide (TPR) repeat protein
MLEEAIIEYKTALILNPYDFKVHNNYGKILVKKGMLYDALMEFRESIRLNPDDPVSHMNLGVKLVKKDLLNEGLQEIELALKLNPGYASAYYELGSVYDKALDTDKARDAFAKFLEFAPKDDDRVERVNRRLIELRELEKIEEKQDAVYQ